MTIIKRDELKKMTAKDAEKKLVEIERALLEAEGEGKRERRKPLKRAIAQLKTIINTKRSTITENAKTEVKAKESAVSKAKQAVAAKPTTEGLKTPSS